MKLATFNVNGIGARLPRLLDWLAAAKPDVVGLQEIKTQTESFPFDAIRAAGYHALVHGQKGFNGVAILSREPAQEVERTLPGDAEDVQSRWIEAVVGGIHFACLYLPNGNPVPGPKFDYKLAWMDRLAARAAKLMATELPVVLAGDWNVCPTDLDVARPDQMAGDALLQPESRARFRALVASGWTEAIRAQSPHTPCYTFWDYQAGAWQKNNGIRIDHLMLSPEAANRLDSVSVDKHVRAWEKNWGLRIDHLLLSPAAADRLVNTGIDRDVRGAERASDHVPVWVELGTS
jgi:exodeoxyribonuclease-3